MPIIKKFFLALCFFGPSLGTAQASINDLTVGEDQASAGIALPGGLGAQLALRFDSAVGVTADSLGLSVSTVDPTSSTLLGLLPGTELALPADFPVLLTIAAPAQGGLAFEGVVEVELYTRNLGYAPGSTLRLFSRSNGGEFRDITDAVSGGSYRVRGSSGQFSEFLIVADERPLADIVELKFTRLNGLLSTHAALMDAAVADALNLLVANAYTYWQANDPGAAIEQVRLLADTAEAAASAGLVPNVWQSSRDVDNVAGLLRAAARTLSFTLGLAPVIP